MPPSARIRDLAHEVNAGLSSAERVAGETLERVADYDAIQPEAWISRVPADSRAR